MSTYVEFGNDVEKPYGTSEVHIQRDRNKITLRARDGQEMVGSARDWRSVACYLMRLTEDIVKEDNDVEEDHPAREG